MALSWHPSGRSKAATRVPGQQWEGAASLAAAGPVHLPGMAHAEECLVGQKLLPDPSTHL